MDTLYADLCEMGQRATRENTLGIKLVPDVLELRQKTEKELERRGVLSQLIEQWNSKQ